MRYLSILIIVALIINIIFVRNDIYNLAQPAEAATTNLTITSCDLNNGPDSTCTTAMSADGSTTYSIAKGSHIDAPFATMTSGQISSVNSATLYYDSWGSLSGTWGIYVTDSRDGTVLCSVDPAPEDGSETTNSTSCSVTAANLIAGVWLYIVNNDDKGPESINLDYIRLYVDYNAPVVVSISMSTDGAVAFGIVPLNTSKDTTSTGINDVEVVSVVSGPADLTAKSSTFSDGSNTWALSTSNGSDIVKWEFSSSTSPTAWSNFAVANTEYPLAYSIASSNTVNLVLQITLPTDTTSYSQYSTTVTITASAP